MTSPLFELPLTDIVPHAWGLLKRATCEDTGSDPLRLPVLATVGADGLPQARVVVLRTTNQEERVLEFYTNARSPKVEALKTLPRGALCFYSQEDQLQLRVSGWVALHHADERAQQAWDETGLYARRSYLTTAPPGSPLESAGDGLPEDYDPQLEGGENLVVVRLHVERLDWLHLAREGHRRAEALPIEGGGWTTRWLVP